MTDIKRVFLRSTFSLLLFRTALAGAASMTAAQAAQDQTTGDTAAETPTSDETPTADTAEPAPQPLYREYKGVSLGMGIDEVRQKLGRAEEKDKTQDFFVFSERERARVYYDDKQKVRALIVTYIGKSSNAPASADVLGAEVSANQDGSAYKLAQYPEAGYWVAYSRTAGDEPLTIITMQKH